MALLLAAAHAQNVPVLMLSDIHFDPYADPAKFAQLNAAPASQWEAIFSEPASPTLDADIAALQKACKAKGTDTSFALLASSLRAEQAAQPHPLFITVSGDLMAHKFDCRFQQLAPKATEAEYSVFAAKTVEFVALELHKTFPRSPIHFALGNNDSGCADYREDPNSAFLRADAHTFATATLNRIDSVDILRDFPQAGDYNIRLPLVHTRLIVLQDIFESKRYDACNGKPNEATGEQQIAWLRTQLTAARAAHEKVWVMAHIPPGIDPYTTFTNKQNKCGGEPEMFLGSESFANTITDFADVIKLALFGHTHMDEMRSYTGPRGSVPGKLVPSISPVNGNNPAFTLAQVNPTTATLIDYTVFVSNNTTGIDAKWTEEYSYSKTYALPDFSGASAVKLAAGFLADKPGTTPNSVAYEKFYVSGGAGLAANVKAAAMQLVWPTFACGIAEAHKDGYKTCLCPAHP